MLTGVKNFSFLDCMCYMTFLCMCVCVFVISPWGQEWRGRREEGLDFFCSQENGWRGFFRVFQGMGPKCSAQTGPQWFVWFCYKSLPVSHPVQWLKRKTELLLWSTATPQTLTVWSIPTSPQFSPACSLGGSPRAWDSGETSRHSRPRAWSQLAETVTLAAMSRKMCCLKKCLLSTH